MFENTEHLTIHNKPIFQHPVTVIFIFIEITSHGCLTSPANPSHGVSHPQQTPAMASHIPSKPQPWRLTSPANPSHGVSHPQQTPAMVSHIPSKPQPWCLTSPANPSHGVSHPQHTPAMVSHIPSKPQPWRLTSPANRLCFPIFRLTKTELSKLHISGLCGGIHRWRAIPLIQRH